MLLLCDLKLSSNFRALTIACIGVLIIMSFNAFIGTVMFARYFGCDPILGGVS